MKKQLLFCILSIFISRTTLDASYSRPTSASTHRENENRSIITVRNQQQNSRISSAHSLRKATLEKVNNKFSPKKNSYSDSDTDLDLTQSSCEKISAWVEKFNSHNPKLDELQWSEEFDAQEASLLLSQSAHTDMSILTSESDLPALTYSESEPQCSPSFKKKQEKIQQLNRKIS